MKNTDRLITTIRSRNPFKQLYRQGISPDNIKHVIVTTLQPFFHNSKILEKLAIEILVSDFINLKRLREKYDRIDEDILNVLSTYHDALSVNSRLLYDSISDLLPDIIEVGNKFWSYVHLERDKSELEFFEFVKESFENMEDIIEGLMKIQIIENVVVNRIVRKKPINNQKIKSTKLGVLLNELIQTSKYSNLFKTEPDKIKFTDWRNIAAHKSYKIKSEIVVCNFGIPPKEKSVSLSRLELFDRLNQIVRTLEVLNLSHKFFGFDNIDKINPTHNKDTEHSSGRDEIWLLSFVSGISSQGFDVLKFEYEPNGNAVMVVKDLTEKDPKERGVHSSQFIYPIWRETRARKICVEYRTYNGKLFLRSSSNSAVCEQISKGVKPFTYLAEKVKFELAHSS